MRRDDVEHALGALASEVPAPRADAESVVERGRRRTRKRQLTLLGFVVLMLAVVLAAGAIARSDERSPRAASVPTTVPSVDVGQRPTPMSPRAQPVPIPLAFVSPTEGWLCSTPTMAYTTDAGESWKSVAVPSHPPVPPRSQVPVCAATPGGDAWMLTTSGDADGLEVVHVSGAGRRVETSAFPPLRSDWTVRDLAFADPEDGWAFASDAAGAASVMLDTTDGGRTWNDDAPVRGVTIFGSSRDGWAALELLPSELAHTTDGGRNWERVELDYGSAGMLRPIGVRGDTVVALSWSPADSVSRNSFVVSKNRGGSSAYRRVPRDLATTPVEDIAASATDADHWQVATGNRLWTTDTGGRAWRQIAEFAGVSAITDVHFLTRDIGFVSATGTGAAADGTVVWRTTDGGESWSLVASHAPPFTSRAAPGLNFPGGIVGCPTQPLAPPPAGNPPAGLVAAATRYVGQGPNGWTPHTIQAYHLGDNPPGSFGYLFSYQVGSCGAATMANAWVVEMTGAVDNRSYIPRAHLAFAYYAEGWRVFGRY